MDVCLVHRFCNEGTSSPCLSPFFLIINSDFQRLFYGAMPNEILRYWTKHIETDLIKQTPFDGSYKDQVGFFFMPQRSSS